jgi:ATP/maltotriose-dependent transcriptional regulator MalT
MRRGSSLGALSNSKVANELFASASSAKVHHVPVYSKLGVTAE